MKKTILSLVALMVIASSAYATTVSGSKVYFLDYNFSGNAYGRAVKSVMVHTAILRSNSGCPSNVSPYWDSVQDVQMKQVGDHFFAQARLSVAASECAPTVEGPIVQYWVTFQDGSSYQSNPARVPVTSSVSGSYNWAAVDAKIQASESTKEDAFTTEAIYVDESFAD
jgi:hypothetical protein